MIGFFRRLRKLFFAEGKFRPYLAYALGEILLVVLGILIAIQINSWYSYKADREKEEVYLVQYQRDLEANLKELDRVIKKQEEVIQSADLIYQVHKGRKEVQPYDSLLNHIIHMANYTLFMSKEGTINDIVGSGNLSLIQNDSLRKSVIGWNNNLTFMREWEQLGKKNAQDVIDLFTQKTDFYEGVYEQSFLDSTEINALVNDQYFLNLAAGKAMSSKILLGSYKTQIEEHQQLLAFLKQELDQ